LAERQAKGLDLGVPILTRYLGEDIPVWVAEGVDEEEWKAKRDARYEEMRKEEEKWREKARKFMQAEEQKRKDLAREATQR
jgi:glucose-6-phosphate-specific signal transduction histidine kinase